MKKLCYSAFIAFWSSIATLVAVNVLATDGAVSAPPTEQGATYFLDQVAAHGGEGDCWFVIEGVVYDLSDYIPNHPTPPSVLLPWCGKEATEAYKTKTKGRPHSPEADQLLPTYKIGTLASP